MGLATRLHSCFAHGRGSWQVLGSRERDAESSLFTQALPTTARTQFQTGRAAAAGREPAPPAPPAAKNNHGRVTFRGEIICMALRAGCCGLKRCCLQGSDCSSFGRKVARIRGCFWWGKRTGSVLQLVWTHSRQWDKHPFPGTAGSIGEHVRASHSPSLGEAGFIPMTQCMLQIPLMHLFPSRSL